MGFFRRENRNKENGGDSSPSLDSKKLIEIKSELQGMIEAFHQTEHEAFDQYDDAKARFCFTNRLKLHRLVGVLDGFVQAKDGSPVYLVSSLFLRECLNYLTRDDDELIHYVTGTERNGILTLDRIIKFDIETKNPVYVKGKTNSTHAVLVQLEQYGHSLLAWCHSHPGDGPGSVSPSSTDLDHQARLERGGYPAIGAIFSRDRHIRFFALDRGFSIQVYGKGVETINEQQNIYRLIEIDQIRNETNNTG